MRKLVPLVAAAVGFGSLTAIPLAATSASAATAKGPVCQEYDSVEVTSRTRHQKVSERDIISNKTKDKITRTVTFEKTETSTWSVGGSVEGSLKAWIFAEIRVQVNASLNKSITLRRQVADTVTVRPGYKMTATRGFRMQSATGYVWRHYSNCSKKLKGNFTLKAPYDPFVEYKTSKA